MMNSFVRVLSLDLRADQVVIDYYYNGKDNLVENLSSSNILMEDIRSPV